MARVLIAGCGYVGSECAARLAAAGEDVTALRRTPTSIDGATTITLDLGDPGACERFFSEEPAFDALIVTIAATRGDEAGYRAAYVDALKTLCASALPAHPQAPLLLFTSSTSVYAQDAGEWIDETSPTEPGGFRGRVQLDAEAIVSRWPGPRSALRLGGIYGPGRTALARKVRDGEITQTANEAHDPYTNRIHRDDAAGALIHQMRRHFAGEALDAIYLGVDNAPAARSEILGWLARGMEATIEAPSQAPALAGARSEPKASEGHAGRPQANKVHQGPAHTGKRCRNTKLRESGFSFTFPTYREGYAAVLRADPEFSSFTPPSP